MEKAYEPMRKSTKAERVSPHAVLVKHTPAPLLNENGFDITKREVKMDTTIYADYNPETGMVTITIANDGTGTCLTGEPLELAKLLQLGLNYCQFIYRQHFIINDIENFIKKIDDEIRQNNQDKAIAEDVDRELRKRIL